MYIDALGLVSDSQAFTGPATTVSTDSIDLGDVTPKREIGTGEAMGFGVAVEVAADFATGDETYQFDVISSAAAALTSPTVIASFVRTAAQLLAGDLHFLPLPQGFPLQRFLGIQMVLGGTTPSVTISSWLTAHDLFSIQTRDYEKGFTIS